MTFEYFTTQAPMSENNDTKLCTAELKRRLHFYFICYMFLIVSFLWLPLSIIEIVINSANHSLCLSQAYINLTLHQWIITEGSLSVSVFIIHLPILAISKKGQYNKILSQLYTVLNIGCVAFRIVWYILYVVICYSINWRLCNKGIKVWMIIQTVLLGVGVVSGIVNLGSFIYKIKYRSQQVEEQLTRYDIPEQDEEASNELPGFN